MGNGRETNALSMPGSSPSESRHANNALSNNGASQAHTAMSIRLINAPGHSTSARNGLSEGGASATETTQESSFAMSLHEGDGKQGQTIQDAFADPLGEI